MRKKYLTKCAGKHRVKRKVKKTNTKPNKIELDINSLKWGVETCTAKINELVANTNEGLGKICDAMDTHEKAIKHFISSQTTMQDAIKTLVNEVNKIKEIIPKKEGE